MLAMLAIFVSASGNLPTSAAWLSLPQARSAKHSQWEGGADPHLVLALDPREGSLGDDIYLGKTQGQAKLFVWTLDGECPGSAGRVYLRFSMKHD